MKRFIFVALIALSLSWMAHIRTDGFSPDLIQGSLLSGTAPPASSEVRQILTQPFHYLAKGRQSFVFESEDGRYVLKFFNQKYLQMPWYTQMVSKIGNLARRPRKFFGCDELALPEARREEQTKNLLRSRRPPRGPQKCLIFGGWRRQKTIFETICVYGFLVGEKERIKRETRRHYYENSYPIAFKEMGDAIVYLHLNSSEPLPPIRFTDRASAEYELDAAQLPFVLQRKGILLYTALEQMFEKEGLNGLYKGIDAFLGAVALRISKNIADGDHNVEDNWGYVDGHIFHLDPGRLYYEEMSDPKRIQLEWDRATHNFYKWLKQKHPEGANYLRRVSLLRTRPMD